MPEGCAAQDAVMGALEGPPEASSAAAQPVASTLLDQSVEVERWPYRGAISVGKLPAADMSAASNSSISTSSS